MVSCNLAECVADKPQGEMTKVVDQIDGRPIVGYACSVEHARQLVLQWTTGDRYSVPDEIWSTVGNGRVAA